MFPNPAWRAVIEALRGGEELEERLARRSTLLELRATGRRVAGLVALHGQGAAGRLRLSRLAAVEEFWGEDTAALGSALLVAARITGSASAPRFCGAIAEAVTRGHLVDVLVDQEPPQDAARDVDAVLRMAAAHGCLAHALLEAGRHAAVLKDLAERAQSLTLTSPTAADLAAIARGRRVHVIQAPWADVAPLAGLREVCLAGCGAVTDVAPLSRVPVVRIHQCDQIVALPAMHNQWLEIQDCDGTSDLAGLSGGTVRCVVLSFLPNVSSIDALAEIVPRIRLVVLDRMCDLDARQVASVAVAVEVVRSRRILQ